MKYGGQLGTGTCRFKLEKESLYVLFISAFVGIPYVNEFRTMHCMEYIKCESFFLQKPFVSVTVPRVLYFKILLKC